VVGSFARQASRLGSDLDLVLLSERPDRFGAWLAEVPPMAPARFLHRRQWGPLTELRLRRRSGLHLDVGVAPLARAATEPVDVGTARVLRAAGAHRARPRPPAHRRSRRRGDEAATTRRATTRASGPGPVR
jgi:hypothetical protein